MWAALGTFTPGEPDARGDLGRGSDCPPLTGAGSESPVPLQTLIGPGRLHHGPGPRSSHLGHRPEPPGAGRNHLGSEPGLHRGGLGLQQDPQGALQGGGGHGQLRGDAGPRRPVRAQSHRRLHRVLPEGRGESTETAHPGVRGLGQDHLPAAGPGGQGHEVRVPWGHPGLPDQGVVGPALRGQRALAGDPVHAGLPAAHHRPHLLQPSPSWCERLIYLWLFSLVCEELRQLLYDPDECGLVKMALLYFSDFWNKLDIAAILLFIAGLTCRLIPGLLYPGRIVLSLDFIMFCLRLMHIFTISKTLGPKIIIVKRMMKDVFFFLFLLAVWVVSFGVAKQAILIHNESRVDWIFRGVVYQSYLTIFGQMPAYIDGVNFSLDQCSPNGTDPYKPKCPESDATRHRPIFPEWLTVILLCLYLLFTNILLLNLLIAMFNYTFQQVQEHTDQIWKFQRHDLIEEYQGRPPAPPPFILLSHLHLFIKRVILKIPAKRHKQLKNKLEKNEEAALLSWEIYLKENYLQNQQYQQKQRTEQKIQDISNRVDTMVDLLEMDRLKGSGSMEQRLASLERQVTQTTRALHWVVKTLRDSGFGLDEGAPSLASQPASEGQDPELDGRQKAEDLGDAHHVNARHLLYPNSPIVRFPVPNEKVPWETEFLIYDPPFYSAERKDKDLVDPVGNALDPLSRITYNAVDGPTDRRSFHGSYAVQDGFPLNPMGRTGLRGRGALCCFGPNHTLQPVVTRWRRNQDGAICRRSIKKVLEVLVVKHDLAEHWALPGGSREPGETLPRKLKQVLQREFWPSFENLLLQGTEVYKGYVDDPRNTDNAWIETVAVSVHFPDQSDVELKRLNSHLHAGDPGMSVRWQVVDKRISLYANHKAILQKVATLFGAYY
ncbi:transient receptor potential cation channel subfamily M member 2 isoform X7 [Myotis lucifugus]|uniref:transient receptor potential cation channel subfamily M member 2 isoform X7 n=1 Tax=Myotis lucifugus TaxID=59463 RepID=UPI000CCC7E54|nr:transient receptor potential cation channel subfamily M member 2 isoform X7 [Myotis lucifugus]